MLLKLLKERKKDMLKTKGISNEMLWKELGKRMENVYEEKQIDQLVSRLSEVIYKIEELVSNNNKEWMTMHEAMEYLDIKPNTFREWRYEGLKVATIGRKLYVSHTEINRFLTEKQI
jgi:hypothetical protein